MYVAMNEVESKNFAALLTNSPIVTKVLFIFILY